MKKFGRKVLALLLCLTMTAGMAVLPVGAVETTDAPVGAYVKSEAVGETFGDFTYRVNDDGETVTITKYTGNDVDVDIPKEMAQSQNKTDFIPKLEV